jgi:hypothetical protein
MVMHIETLVRVLPVKQLAQLLRLPWHTVKAIDYQLLTREVLPPDLSQVRRPIMDNSPSTRDTATQR